MRAAFVATMALMAGNAPAEDTAGVLASAIEGYGAAVSVELGPCAVRVIKQRPSMAHMVDIRYGLDVARVGEALQKRLPSGAIELLIPQPAARGRRLSDQWRQVVGRSGGAALLRHEVGADTARAVARGEHGAELARNHFTVTRRRPGGRETISLFAAYPMVFDLRPDQADAALSVLEHWQAETCTGS